jgi:predicted ATPase
VAIHLRAVSAKRAERDEYPFNVPVIQRLDSLTFDAPVTFFVGENGSGKSTLMEGMAVAAALPTVGAADVREDETLAAARALGATLRLAWNVRTHRGFFLRAEDFFGFTKTLARERRALRQRLTELDTEYANRSAYAKALASGPMASSLRDIEARYGADLDANSHGQAFLRLFRSRFVPGGLYLLDEPEAPLSPQSQLAFLALVHEMVRQDAQFIIATHAPILLAYPDAQTVSFDVAPAAVVPFDELDHVRLTRDVLTAPGRVFRHLFEDRR